MISSITKQGDYMEIIKINNINDFLVEDKTQCDEVICTKLNIEKYIATFFAPTINLKLDENLNLVFDGKNFGIVLDTLSLLMPLAKLLDIKFKDASLNDLREFLSHSIQNRLHELKGIKTKEELLLKFPVLYNLYHNHEELIKKSFELECESKRIVPVSEGESIKYKKLREFGINKEMHFRLLNEASTFSFESFMNTYYAELERIIINLTLLITTINTTILPIDNIKSIDAKKVTAHRYREIYKQKQKQKQRELK